MYPRAVLTLRQRRTLGQPFDGRFFERSGLFWPIARGAEKFAKYTDWPDVAEYARVFHQAPVVRFVAEPPRVRRRAKRRGPSALLDPHALYDGRIALAGSVPTRPRSWHDFLNALVWGAFPRAKTRLHARQHAAIVRSLPPGARTLPPARSRQHDALALVDEGGVIVLDDERGRALRVVFGHAIFEGLVLDVRATVARAVCARVDCIPENVDERVALADEVLAAWLAAEGMVPEDLPRIAL